MVRIAPYEGNSVFSFERGTILALARYLGRDESTIQVLKAAASLEAILSRKSLCLMMREESPSIPLLLWPTFEI